MLIKHIRTTTVLAKHSKTCMSDQLSLSRLVSDDHEPPIPQWLSRLARRTYKQYEKCEGREFDPPLGNFFMAPPLFNS